MQVISRGVDESLVIGDMVVTVLEVQPTHVRLGISDPEAIPPYWEETLYVEDAAEACESEALAYS